MKYKIEYKKKIPYGYIGMNKFASKPHHIDWTHSAHTLEIKKNMSHLLKVTTEHHEMMEAYLMKNRHYNYHKAHQIALKFETLGKPFPTYNIKENLTRMGFLKRRIKRKKRFK